MPPRAHSADDMTRTTRALACGAVAFVLGLSACAGAEEADTELVVLAAASLTDVFEDLASAFEGEYADVSVTLALGSSSELAGQAADGAPGDVLAAADESSLRLAQEAGVTGEVVAFATNELTIVTPPGNPADIRSLADLEAATWVRCAAEAPCGRVADTALADAGVTAEPASLEEDVRAVLDKVVSGEAEAGLVYATDALTAGDGVETVRIVDSPGTSTTYFATVLEQSTDPDLAEDWVDFVTSDAGLAILDDAGFGAP